MSPEKKFRFISLAIARPRKAVSLENLKPTEPIGHMVCQSNKYPDERNQCDGCQAKMPLKNGIHYKERS